MSGTHVTSCQSLSIVSFLSVLGQSCFLVILLSDDVRVQTQYKSKHKFDIRTELPGYPDKLTNEFVCMSMVLNCLGNSGIQGIALAEQQYMASMQLQTGHDK